MGQDVTSKSCLFFASGVTLSISKSPFCVLCFLKKMNVNYWCIGQGLVATFKTHKSLSVLFVCLTTPRCLYSLAPSVSRMSVLVFFFLISAKGCDLDIYFLVV